MPWEDIFDQANNFAIICWAVLAFAPKRSLFVTPLFYGGVGLLSVAYTALFVALVSGNLDPGVGDEGGSPNLMHITGVMAFFDTVGGVTVAWIHYLAFDLFVGIWAARNADSRGINRVVQLPILFFILMAGPLGLTLYLILRQFIGEKLENSTVPS